MILWGISAMVGLLQNWIYSETATMFPDKPGGIALYAHEGWRKYFNLFGPIAAFGYWIGWSVVLSIFGNLIGALVVAEWFPQVRSPAGRRLLQHRDSRTGRTWPSSSGSVVIIGVWLFNIFGVKPSLRGRLRDRGAADDPARDLHRRAVFHRRLASRRT